MTKPINYRGAYVIEPKKGDKCYEINGIYTIQSFHWQFDAEPLGAFERVYITKEAAEAALLRATSKRRLEVLAGTFNLENLKINNDIGELNVYDNDRYLTFSTGVLFQTFEGRIEALATLTQEEKDAWLFCYNPKN